MSDWQEEGLPEGFQCEYAPEGHRRCHPAICDCFVDTFPDSPFELHPEVFVVNRPEQEVE